MGSTGDEEHMSHSGHSEIERELAELAGLAGLAKSAGPMGLAGRPESAGLAGQADVGSPAVRPTSSPASSPASSPEEVARAILRRRVERRRDLTLVRLAGPYYLVIACDSDGGIGPKPHDTVKVPGYLVGRFAARVPLMEMLASGARPLVLADALSVELEPTGKEIIEGVRFEAGLAGIEGEGAVTGSTEDNVPTVATGIGVTAIGLAEEHQLRAGTAAPDDIIAAVGVPKSAPQDAIMVDDPEIADVPTVMKLAEMAMVHDILPVGSKGIGYEAHQMAASAGLGVVLTADPGLNTRKSAGPATCVLVSVAAAAGKDGDSARQARHALDEIRRAVGKPVALVGRLTPDGGDPARPH